MTASVGINETGRSGRPTRRSRWLKMGLAVWLLGLIAAGRASDLDQAPAGQATNQLFRIGFSTSMFADVNENDAKAAVKVWTQILSEERGIPFDPEAKLLNSTEAIARAFRSNLIDGIAMQADEYLTLYKEISFGNFIANIKDGQPTEEYILLVHRDSGISRVGDLKERSVLFPRGARMSMAPIWLETLLLQEGLGRTARFFGRVTHANKLAQVVLPVFFRKTAACVVTRSGFDIMRELNPQVGQQLRVIASSPPVVPGGFYIRSDYSSSFKEKILDEIEKMHLAPAGQQVLTIFQSERLERRPMSCLDSAVELAGAHSRLLAAWLGTNALPHGLLPSSPGANGGR